MSKYPEWWDTTVTIFNKFEDPQTQVVTWFKHQIDGSCFWKYTGDKLTINETTIETNTVLCRIPKQDDFLEKYQWVALPNDRMGDYFTIGQGDIIIRGAVNDEIDEYRAGKRSSDLLGKYKALQGCMQVEVVAINVGPGRCNEHYLVKGI